MLLKFLLKFCESYIISMTRVCMYAFEIQLPYL